VTSPTHTREPQPDPSPGPSTGEGLAWVFALALAGALTLVGCSRTAASGPAPDEAMELVRSAADTAAPERWREELDLAVGGPAFTLARWGGRFAPIPPELQAALKAARGVAVSVSSRSPAPRRQGAPTAAPAPDHATWPSITAACEAAGMDRVVAVVEGDEQIVIWLPRNWNGKSDVTVCVYVEDRGQRVIVGAQLAPEPLLELVESTGALDRTRRRLRQELTVH
jgi:hypothetical protein